MIRYLSTRSESTGRDRRGIALDKADLVKTIGYDFVEYPPGTWNTRTDREILHIDSTPAEVDASYQPDIQLIGQISETLQLLTGYLETRQGDHDESVRKEILREVEDGSDDVSYPMKPRRILHEIRAALRRDEILISDVGEHKNWISRLFTTYEPRDRKSVV